MSVEIVLMIVVLLTGFYMAWNIGANDVANAIATSVGAGALTLTKAVIMAGILEFCGAFFLGSNVSETMQKGIVDLEIFSGDPNVFMLGMLASLLSTAIWLQIASYFGWPVSTTHAIVGAILGFGVVVAGADAIHWSIVGSIALSWILSPALSALISFLIFTVLQRQILFALNPIEAARRLIPFLVFVVFATFCITTLTDGVSNLEINFGATGVIAVSFGVALLCALISWLLVRRQRSLSQESLVPSIRLSQQVFSLNKAAKHLQRVCLSASGETRRTANALFMQVDSLAKNLQHQTGYYSHTSDYTIVEKMFSYLQIVTACFVAFAHGANDVANAIGPVAAILDVVRSKQINATANVPTWLLAFGGIGIVVGLATWGWRVIETIGKKITELTPTRGFSAEFGAATTILLASKIGMPISTTHCVVGAVLGVGLARGISALNLRMLREIVLSWIITIPSSAIVSVLFYQLLKIIFTPFLV